MKKLLLFLLFFSGHLYAEPSKTTKYLMNDSLSMLEWGIFKIDNVLNTEKYPELDSVTRNSFDTTYDWDSNELTIKAVVYPSYEKLKKIGNKEACRLVLSSLKTRFGYHFRDSKVNFLSIANYFKHKGFYKREEPDTFSKDIEKMTRLTVKIYSSETNKPNFDRQSECTSKFLESEVYFVDKE